MPLFTPNIRKLQQKRDVKGLLRVLRRDPLSLDAHFAAEALGELGDKRAIPALIERLSQVKNLNEMDGREFKRMFRGAQIEVEGIGTGEDRYDYTPSTTGIVLGKLGDETLVSQLLDLLASPNYHVREGVAIALGGIGDRRALVPLGELLDDPQDAVRRAALYSLAQMRDASSLPLFLRVVEESSDRVAVNIAARAIGSLGDKDSVPTLLNALKRLEESVAVLDAAAIDASIGYITINVPAGIVEALEMLGDKRAIPALQELLPPTSTIEHRLTPHDLVRRAIATLEKSGT